MAVVQAEAKIDFPIIGLTKRSIEDLKVNGIEYLERINESSKNLEKRTKDAWSQTVFNPDIWVKEWDEFIARSKAFIPDVVKMWSSFTNETVKAAFEADSYLQIKHPRDIMASTQSDFDEIMRELENAAIVDARIAASHSDQFDVGGAPIPNYVSVNSKFSTERQELISVEEPAPEVDPDNAVFKKEKEILQKVDVEPQPKVDERDLEFLGEKAELESVDEKAPPKVDEESSEFTEEREGLEEIQIETIPLVDVEVDTFEAMIESLEEIQVETIPAAVVGGEGPSSFHSGVDLTQPKGVIFRNYDVETFKFSEAEEPMTYQEVYHDKRSIGAEWILNSGLDFLSNMWDVSLICTKPSGSDLVRWDDLFTQFYNNEVIFGSTSLPKFMGDAAVFMIRCDGIDVPRPKSQTFQDRFLWTPVYRMKSVVDFTRKTSLKVLLDEPMYFLEVFNLLSNNNDLTSKITVRPLLNVPFTTNPLFRSDLKEMKIQINIVVKHALLIRHYVYDNLRMEDDPIAKMAGGLGPDEVPYWVFEDCNFLGVTTDVEFKRDAPSTLVMDVPFLFKRLFKVDRQPRSGTKTVPAVPLQSPRDPTDAKIPSLSGTQHDQTWYYGERG